MIDLENKTDEELCHLAQKGNSKATETLLLRCKNLVRGATRSFFLAGGDEYDLFQEGMIGVFKAIMDFNGKSSFKSFATLCVKRNVITAIKKSTSGKQLPLNNYVSLTGQNDFDLDNMEIIVNSEVIDPETKFLNKESANELNVRLKDLLSKYEYQILSYYLQGFSYYEIAQKLEKQEKSIDNALCRIRKKIQNYLEERLKG